MPSPSSPPVPPAEAAPVPTLWHDAFYAFVRLDQPEAVAQRLRELTAPLKGSVLVASEGLNGMLAGSAEALDAFRQALASEPLLGGAFAAMPFKRSACTTPPFHRIKVHVKPEIVPLGIAGIDATCRTGINVSPQDWRALIADPDVLVVDNRNSFEFRLGRFRRAVNPQVNNFRDFPAYVRAQRADWQARGQKVAMYCTGGIRCEKTSAWMLDLGLPVYQLEGGILNYFAQMPDAHRDWDGACFVFDNRVALDTRLQETGTPLEAVYRSDLPDEAWRLRRARLLQDSGD